MRRFGVVVAATFAVACGGSSKSPSTGQYGVLTSVSFSTPYILDQTQVQSGGATYLNQHPEAFVPTAFTGHFGASRALPATGTTQALALHSPTPTVYLKQLTVSNGSVVSPAVELDFPSDAIAVADLQVGWGAGTATLVVYDVSSTTQNGFACIHALGFGTLHVTQAQNTTAAEGGALAFTSSNVALHHPGDTPVGNLTSQLSGVAPACPRD